MNIYELIVIAKKLGFTFDELREISFVTLANIIYSVNKDEQEEEIKEAEQKDIDALFG